MMSTCSWSREASCEEASPSAGVALVQQQSVDSKTVGQKRVSGGSEHSGQRSVERDGTRDSDTTLGFGLGVSRELRLSDPAAAGYRGALQLDVLMAAERPGLLRVVSIALGGWGTDDDRWGGGLDALVGGGYWTNELVFYGGLVLGMGAHDANQKMTDGNFGLFADAGVDFGGFRLMFDVRVGYQVEVRRDNFTHASYGGLLSVDL